MIRECNNSNGPEGKLLELIKVGKVLQKKPLVLAMGLDEFCSHNGLFCMAASNSCKNSPRVLLSI